MSAASDELMSMLVRYRTYAIDGVKRRLLAEDSACLQYIVQSLTNHEQSIVQAALEVLELICSDVKTRSFVHLISGVFEKKLAKILQSTLLKLKGIVSIYFTDNHRKCIIRMRPEVTLEAIRCIVNGCKLPDLEWVYKDANGMQVRFSSLSDLRYDCSSDSCDNLPGFHDDNPLDSNTALVSARQQKVTSGGGWHWWDSVASFISDNVLW
ncbi:unnamed protein product [Soboliphyme baturini]|uniref:Armadillo repeat-containing protein n=1 Tax=Soboliphyme baturini TaxID=241478 RepID=A0A183IV36_9BILA|nr:unnamed protein product [Soboliphyme baturini]